MPTRDEITTALATQRERVERWFRSLPEDEMLRSLTASEVEGSAMWSPKDHLAHIVGTERYFQGAIRRALEGAEDPCGFYTATGHDDDAARLSVANPSNEKARAKYQDRPSWGASRRRARRPMRCWRASLTRSSPSLCRTAPLATTRSARSS